MRSYEGRIRFDIRLLKKSYCAKCGSKLKIVQREYVEFRHGERWAGLWTGIIEDYIGHYLYTCKKCNYDITYRNQKLIAKQQKEEGSLIISGAKNKINELKFKLQKNQVKIKNNRYYVED